MKLKIASTILALWKLRRAVPATLNPQPAARNPITAARNPHPDPRNP